MKTKLCDACRATGCVIGKPCLHCRGDGYVERCDDCVEGEPCLTCLDSGVVGCSEDDPYAEKCALCEGLGDQLCGVCLGAGVVIMETGEPVPRVLEKNKLITGG